MSKHWNPHEYRRRSGAGRPSVPRSRSTRWLSPEAYRTLSREEKRLLYAAREAERQGYEFGDKLKAIVLLAILVGVAWVKVFGVPAPIQHVIHQSSAPVSAIFGSCKWGGGTDCVVDGDTF
jgi:hypothetical protein